MEHKDSFAELRVVLSQFEHRRITWRRRYMFQYDSIKSNTTLMIQCEFYNQIKSLAQCEQNEFTYPPKVEQTHHKLLQLFGEYSEDLLYREAESAHKKVKVNDCTFKNYVSYFRHQLEDLMLMLLPEEFQFFTNIFSLSADEIIRPFVQNLNAQKSTNDQIAFCQNRENLEAVLLTAEQNPKFLNFCYTPEMKKHWEMIAQKVHPEILAFLVDTYSHETNADAFMVMQLLYRLHNDLSNMHYQTLNILLDPLPAFEHNNAHETLCAFMNPNGQVADKKDKTINSLSFIQCNRNLGEFYNRPELDFVSTRQEHRKSFFNDIINKDFSWLMQTLFRSYIQLIADHYEFTATNNQINAQRRVFNELTTIKAFQDSLVLQAFQTKLQQTQQFNSQIVDLETQFHNAIQRFFANTSIVEKDNIDEDYLVHVLIHIADPEFNYNIPRSAIDDLQQSLENLLSQFQNLYDFHHYIKSSYLQAENNDNLEQQLLQSGMYYLKFDLIEKNQFAKNLQQKFESIIAHIGQLHQNTNNPF